MNLSLWRTKKALCSGRRRNGSNEVASLALTGKPRDAVQIITSAITALAFNGSNVVDATVVYRIWPRPMRNSANLMTLGAALTKR